ncbi:uncharacterized protein LOC128985095 [Macrosteles quadrilineatus]|uniref:uncharacterized protein LOC128985095 n=1 Tax=Macrosteles quadrilineatus TaxID=74068 RepID=UPI0023E2BA52|nr:uncharacterized protein LOC128985095 [Macrosteles quadrilineatus]
MGTTGHLGHVIIVLLVTPALAAQDGAEPRFFTKEELLSEFREGWEAAGRLVGFDTSQGLGALVSSSWAPAATEKHDVHPDAAAAHPSIFHGFFRLLGFDSTRLNAIAVNAVVFIAKMIGSSLIRNWTSGAGGGNVGGRALGDEDVEESLSWVIDSVKDKARGILSRAQSEDLGDQLISALQDIPGETDCVQLLVCRASPLLNTMRRSLRALLDGESVPAGLSPLQKMLYYLPTRHQLTEAAVTCRRRLPSCSQLFE